MAKCKKVGRDTVLFECVSCGSTHSIDLKVCEWNGDTQKPTFSHSLPIVYWYGSDPKKKYICHSIISDGKIIYLHDSTHSLAGQTIDLPDYD